MPPLRRVESVALLNPFLPLTPDMRQAFYAGIRWLQGGEPTIHFIYPHKRDDLRDALEIPLEELIVEIEVHAPLGTCAKIKYHL